jgi:hypothetical protein
VRRPGGTTAGPSPLQLYENCWYQITFCTGNLHGTTHIGWALCCGLRLSDDFFAFPRTRRLAASGQAQT